MRTSLVQSSCLLVLPLLLSPTAGHASAPEIDWANSCRALDAAHWESDLPGSPAAKLLTESGLTRNVKLIYFIPNDRTFNSDVVDSIKARIPRMQTFFGDQMQARGYGNKTFQFETDDQGDPLVHRVDAPNSDASYLSSYRIVGVGNVLRDLRPTFDSGSSILFIVVDHSTYDNLGWGSVAGFGGRRGKNSGYALLPASFIVATATHELGHAFGLQHDFNDGKNIMSYGPGWNRLSTCSAGFLTVHPYFDADVPIEEQQTWDLLAPTVQLVSPLRYTAGSTSLSLQFRVTSSGGRGLQQALFFLKSRAPHPAAGSAEVKGCHDLQGVQDTVVVFQHDGVIPSEGSGSLSSSPAHFVSVQALDSEGNANSGPYRDSHFVLAEESPHHLATLFRNTSEFSPEIYGAKFSPDGTILAVSSSAGVQIWDTGTRAAVATLSGRSSALAFSPDGATLASGSSRTNEANLKLWNVASQTLVATLPGHTGGPTGVTSLAFSPGGDTLASGSGDQTIKLWDVANQSLIATLTGHTSHVWSVAFSPDGTLASGSRDGTVKLWDAASQTNTATLEGNTGRVLDVAFSPRRDPSRFEHGRPDASVGGGNQEEHGHPRGAWEGVLFFGRDDTCHGCGTGRDRSVERGDGKEYRKARASRPAGGRRRLRDQRALFSRWIPARFGRTERDRAVGRVRMDGSLTDHLGACSPGQCRPGCALQRHERRQLAGQDELAQRQAHGRVERRQN